MKRAVSLEHLLPFHAQAASESALQKIPGTALFDRHLWAPVVRNPHRLRTAYSEKFPLQSPRAVPVLMLSAMLNATTCAQQE
jgi:hypothetical protein